MNLWEYLERAGLVIALSLAGGLAGAVRRKECSFLAFLGSCVVALFSGMVTFMLLEDLNGLSETVKAGIAGVSAYSGGSFLDAMRDRLASIAEIIIGGAKK